MLQNATATLSQTGGFFDVGKTIDGIDNSGDGWGDRDRHDRPADRAVGNGR